LGKRNLMSILFKQKSRRIILGTLITIVAMATLSSAQEAVKQNVNPTIKIGIRNFGRMDDRFYRGAQPNEKDYKALVALGIKTVIDLRDDPQSFERPLVESLGMKYVNIPMADKKYPTPEVTQMFLKVVSDPASGKFFVHCAGGRHRTGAMGAVYRYEFYHWNFDQVYKEMKQYDFYTSWGHGAFKDFVEEYYARMQAGKGSNHSANSLAGQNK
ncbi:MAG: tyrosine-protein phosphatase, partial [Acidobacteriota bacterium]